MNSNEQLELFLIDQPSAPDIGEVRKQVALDSQNMMAARATAGSDLYYEDPKVSEAAKDQGHGPQERGVLLDSYGEPMPRRTAVARAAQRAAAEKRRKRWINR